MKQVFFHSFSITNFREEIINITNHFTEDNPLLHISYVLLTYALEFLTQIFTQMDAIYGFLLARNLLLVYETSSFCLFTILHIFFYLSLRRSFKNVSAKVGVFQRLPEYGNKMRSLW